MGALNHVLMICDKGWKKVTVEEAGRIYHDTVSASSGIFMCDLCGQPVTFTKGEKNARYFRHTKDADAYCPEKVVGSGAPKYDLNNLGLPIRLVNVSREGFGLEIGIINPKHIDFTNKQGQIKIFSDGLSSNSVIYNVSRLEDRFMTYLPIGDRPSIRYRIEVSGVADLGLPKVVDGIGSQAVFEADTGKKLETDDDLKVGSEYYLLARSRTSGIGRDIELKHVTSKMPWNVYRLIVKRFSKDAAKEILKSLKLRLTTLPTTMQLVWPLYIENPFLAKVQSDLIWVHCRSMSPMFFKTNPATPFNPYSGVNGCNVYAVKINNKQQLISSGRYMRLLEYTYIDVGPIDKVQHGLEACVKDKNGNDITCGESNELPVERELKVTLPYDGFLFIKHDGDIIYREELKSDYTSKITGLSFGDTIEVYMGLDLVWSLKFIKKQDVLDENMVISKLKGYNGKRIPFGHEAGKLARGSLKYPKLKRWIYSQFRIGSIDIRAFRYLSAVLGGEVRKND